MSDNDGVLIEELVGSHLESEKPSFNTKCRYMYVCAQELQSQ